MSNGRSPCSKLSNPRKTIRSCPLPPPRTRRAARVPRWCRYSSWLRRWRTFWRGPRGPPKPCYGPAMAVNFSVKIQETYEKIDFFFTEVTRVMKNDGWIKKYVIFHQFGWLTFQTWRLHKVKLRGWTLGWVGEILGSEAIEWPENGGFLTAKSKQVPKGNSWDWPRIGFLPSKQGKAWCRVYFI